MKTNQLQKNSVRLVPQTHSGMTLMEVMVALAITGLAVGGIVGGYAFCTTSAEKAALSLAASARAMERLEESRSAKWDLSTWPTVDQLVPTNFPDKVVTLDLSGSGAGATSARILTEIFQISTDPPLKQIRAHCIWTFQGQRLTNTIETCRAPDQ
jgi:prepilin-type N-terminal cleavage/methylation domain-containing protein